MIRRALALLLLFATAASTAPLRYQIDAPRSQVAAKVAFFGLASKTAQFPKMSGGISLVPGKLDAIDLDISLDAGALVASDRVTTERLRGPKFFDVQRYPTIRFTGREMTMTSERTARVKGAITARGITRPTELAVTFDQPPAQASGRVPIGLTASGTIDRADFGMKAYSLIVGRKVTLTIKAHMVPG